MKQLPDPKTLNELLELAKDAFHSAKEMNDLAIKIEEKYQFLYEQNQESVESERKIIQ